MENWRKYNYRDNPQYILLKKWQEKKEIQDEYESEREVQRIIEMMR